MVVTLEANQLAWAFVNPAANGELRPGVFHPAKITAALWRYATAEENADNGNTGGTNIAHQVEYVDGDVDVAPVTVLPSGTVVGGQRCLGGRGIEVILLEEGDHASARAPSEPHCVDVEAVPPLMSMTHQQGVSWHFFGGMGGGLMAAERLGLVPTQYADNAPAAVRFAKSAWPDCDCTTVDLGNIGECQHYFERLRFHVKASRQIPEVADAGFSCLPYVSMGTLGGLGHPACLDTLNFFQELCR